MARKKTIIELTEDERTAIQRYLFLKEKYDKSFFWRQVPTRAASRRKEENENSFEFENERMKISFDLRISTKRYYVSKYVQFDSVFHNALFLRNLL